jgi:hypothetical protein
MQIGKASKGTSGPRGSGVILPRPAIWMGRLGLVPQRRARPDKAYCPCPCAVIPGINSTPHGVTDPRWLPQWRHRASRRNGFEVSFKITARPRTAEV